MPVLLFMKNYLAKSHWLWVSLRSLVSCVLCTSLHMYDVCVCVYITWKRWTCPWPKEGKVRFWTDFPFTLVWLICWWQIVKLFEIISNLWISFVIIFLILPYQNGPPLGHINAKTQELPGALPPGPPPGRCPWTPSGALKRAPGPPAVNRSLRSH